MASPVRLRPTARSSIRLLSGPCGRPYCVDLSVGTEYLRRRLISHQIIQEMLFLVIEKIKKMKKNHQPRGRSEKDAFVYDCPEAEEEGKEEKAKEEKEERKEEDEE